MSRDRSIASERGITMVEMMVSVALGMIVILGIFALTEVAIRSSARTAARVDADQRARPVLQRLIDELHSTCIGPEAGPILAGSDDNEISFLHQTGSAVGPTPDRRVVTLTGSTLSESVYPSTGGEAPELDVLAHPVVDPPAAHRRRPGGARATRRCSCRRSSTTPTTAAPLTRSPSTRR